MLEIMQKTPWIKEDLLECPSLDELHCKERAQAVPGRKTGNPATLPAKIGMMRSKDFVSRQSVRVSAPSW